MSPPLECQAVPPLLSRLLDGTGSTDETLRVRLHLVGCGACRTLDAQLAFTRRAVAQLAARRRAAARTDRPGRPDV